MKDEPLIACSYLIVDSAPGLRAVGRLRFPWGFVNKRRFVRSIAIQQAEIILGGQRVCLTADVQPQAGLLPNLEIVNSAVANSGIAN